MHCMNIWKYSGSSERGSLSNYKFEATYFHCPFCTACAKGAGGIIGLQHRKCSRSRNLDIDLSYIKIAIYIRILLYEHVVDMLQQLGGHQLPLRRP